jgi:uncharacterized membrane protein YgcG
MHAAEAWQPGVAGADNGIIVFIFPADRRVQVLVGYGLESVIPDAEVHRLVGETLLPAARAGNFPAGVEALVQPLIERLRTVPRAEPKQRRNWRVETVLVAAQEIPRRARQIRAVWLANPPRPRLLISAAVAFGVALFAVLIARIVHCGVLVGRRIAARGDAGGLGRDAGELIDSLLRLAQVTVILFVIAVGTSFFFPGTGSFGGAGVDFPW